jgi:diacylglycerol kinase family enzyme
MKLPGAAVDLSDGRFELLLVPVPKSPQDLQKLIRAVAYQDYDSSEGLIFRHVRHVVAETQETIPWTLDGEYAPGGERIEICIEDNGIKMML